MSELFAYQARSHDGSIVGGTLAAASRADAIDALFGRNLAVTSLVRASSVRGSIAGARNAFQSIEAARVGCVRAIATLVRAGVPLPAAIESAAAGAEAPRLRAAFGAVCADLERGTRLSDALGRYPREFPEILRAIVLAGETAGALDDALERAAEIAERSHRLRMRVIGALAYPAIVACMAAGLVLFLVGAVVPELATTLREAGTALPAATAALLAVGDAVRNPIVLVLAPLVLSATILGGMMIARTRHGAVLLDRAVLRIPVVGALIRRSETACVARTLAALLAGGVSLREAIAVAGAATGSPTLRASFEQVTEAVSLGQRIAPAFAMSRMYDPIFLTLVRAGEESGALDAMLTRVADYLDDVVTRSATTLGAAIEPLMILGLGAAIGAIVAAVLVPLYATIGSLG